ISPCYGGNSGSITVTANGGTSPYQYSKDGGSTWQTSNYFSVLYAGTYTVKVKDNNSCTSSNYSVTITQPSAISFSFNPSNPSCCGCSNGSISLVSVSGGTPLYQYSKDGGSNWQTSSSFSGLVAGTYQVVIRDANYCYATIQNV